MSSDSDQITSQYYEHRKIDPDEKNPLLPTHKYSDKKLVAEIFFKTAQPEQGWRDGFQPSGFEDYLDENDRFVLKQVLGGEDVVKNGKLLDSRVLQLLRQHWGFLGGADDRSVTGGNTKLCVRRRAIVVHYLAYLLIKHDDTATPTYRDGLLFPGSKQDFTDEWRFNVIQNIRYGALYTQSLPTGVRLQEDLPDPSERARATWRVTQIYAEAVEKPVKNVPETCGGYHARDSRGWSYDKNANTISNSPKTIKTLGSDEIEAARTPPFDVDSIEKPLAGTVNQAYKIWKRLSGAEQNASNGLKRVGVAMMLQKAVYCYRFKRMVLHEIFRGHWDPTPAPSLTLNSTAGQAANEMLCRSEYGIPSCYYELLKQQPFGEIPTNTQDAEYNLALLIFHLHLVRTNPWYRAAYMREYPGKSPAVGTSTTIRDAIYGTVARAYNVHVDSNKFELLSNVDGFEDWNALVSNLNISERPNLPSVDDWVYTPSESWADLPEPTRKYLEEERGDISWTNAKTRYLNGKDHNVHMKSFGGYDYSNYRFMYNYKEGENEGKTFAEAHETVFENQLKPKLKAHNGGYEASSSSYVTQLRDAVKRGQELVKEDCVRIIHDDLSGNISKSDTKAMYDVYVEEIRDPAGLPDYTA